MPVQEPRTDDPATTPCVEVVVRFFAGARAAAGVEEESVALSAPTTVGQLATELVRRHGPELARVLAACSYIVDEIVVSSADGADRDLRDGAHIDVLPPFAGG